ncbi:ABC transporter [Anopheles sinensis]|uniref:ABC transporter n=1 Tax=Anopheles sinensis TaxID=74873 RepID=A0A084WLD2_ANOSI|nr:ABC transporter [Anopheles sinensis]
MYHLVVYHVVFDTVEIRDPVENGRVPCINRCSARDQSAIDDEEFPVIAHHDAFIGEIGAGERKQTLPHISIGKKGSGGET